MKDATTPARILSPERSPERPEVRTEPGRSLSFVIPLYNESGSLRELHRGVTEAAAGLADDYEILFVDDGSTDNSPVLLEELFEEDPHVGVIRLRRNFGKSAAINAGFKEATGDLIFTLDADLQDDPAEIPRFVERIEEGYDVVSGWKRERKDPFGRRIASLLYNRIVRALTGTELHDINCGFKCYRREVIREIEVYGELHRFIPPMARARGFRIGEVVVRHHPRRYGTSRYGMERFLSGCFDFLTTIMITRYMKKPMHFFGVIGLALFFSGIWINAFLTFQWFQGTHLNNRPLLLLGILLMILGLQITLSGLLADMIAFASKRDQEYSLHSVRRHPPGNVT